MISGCKNVLHQQLSKKYGGTGPNLEWSPDKKSRLNKNRKRSFINSAIRWPKTNQQQTHDVMMYMMSFVIVLTWDVRKACLKLIPRPGPSIPRPRRSSIRPRQDRDQDPSFQDWDVHRSRDRVWDLRRHLTELILFLKVHNRILLFLYNFTHKNI